MQTLKQENTDHNKKMKKKTKNNKKNKQHKKSHSNRRYDNDIRDDNHNHDGSNRNHRVAQETPGQSRAFASARLRLSRHAPYSGISLDRVPKARKRSRSGALGLQQDV